VIYSGLVSGLACEVGFQQAGHPEPCHAVRPGARTV